MWSSPALIDRRSASAAPPVDTRTGVGESDAYFIAGIENGEIDGDVVDEATGKDPNRAILSSPPQNNR